jgi:hypothetical protein
MCVLLLEGGRAPQAGRQDGNPLVREVVEKLRRGALEVLTGCMIVCEGVYSMAFFWPRNEIMFIEGRPIHSAEYLRQVAREFQTLHWARVAFNVAACASIFVGFMRFYSQMITSLGFRRVSCTE